MGSSKNFLNTTLKKMGRLDKVIALNQVIVVMILICVPFLVLR